MMRLARARISIPSTGGFSDVDLGPGVSLGGTSTGGGPEAILSPDSSRLVYVSQHKLFVRREDGNIVIALSGRVVSRGCRPPVGR